MSANIIAVLGPIWAVLGLAILVYGIRARHSERAAVRGCVAASVLWVGGGAMVNAGILAFGGTYSGFADAAYVEFVSDTWESLVVPKQGLFIGLLIVFEAVAGVLVLVPGALRRAALAALIAFNVALLSFGWGFFIWSVPVGVGLALLLRADLELSRDAKEDLMSQARPRRGEAPFAAMGSNRQGAPRRR